MRADRWFRVLALGCTLLATPALAGDAVDDIRQANAQVVALYRAGQYQQGVVLAEATLKKAEAELGPEHSGTLAVVNSLARLYQRQGRYGDAEKLFWRAEKGMESVLGLMHPDTLVIINNLAGLYQSTGRYSYAESLYQSMLEAQERVLGREHPDTLTTVNNLAGLYEDQGRYGDAEPLHQRALEVRERVLGREHPETLTSVNDLAGLYVSQGRYGDAEPLYKRALEARERVSGREHPATLSSVNNLAFLYQSQGRYSDAERLYQRALEVRERVLGREHPKTLTSANNLAGLYNSQGRYGDAERLYRRALEARERILGREHPDTLGSVNNLAGLYRSQGRYGEAELLYQRVLEASERVLGREHPDTLGSVNNLADIYESQGRYGDAEALFLRVLGAMGHILGREHPSTLTTTSNLAGLYDSQGRYGDAEQLYQRVLDVRERVLGREHPGTLISLNNLAAIYVKQSRDGDAEPLFLRVLEVQERVLGREHPDTLSSVNNLASLYESQGRYGDAEPLFQRVLEASERVLGREHPDTLISVNNLAALYDSQGRYSDAEPLFQRALEVRERVLGREHPDTLSSVNNLAALYDSQGRYGDAEPLYQRALEARERVLGRDHPDTIGVRINQAMLFLQTHRADEALAAFRTVDSDLSSWLGIQTRTTRSDAIRRQLLAQNSGAQNVVFSLAVAKGDLTAVQFAADLTLRWKKRLAPDDARLNALARQSPDPQVAEAVKALGNSRGQLSNAALNPDLSSAQKENLRKQYEEAEAKLRALLPAYRTFQTAQDATSAEVQAKLPVGAALIEYRFFKPYDFDAREFGDQHLLAVVIRPDGAPTVHDLGDAQAINSLVNGIIDPQQDAASFHSNARQGYGRLLAPLQAVLKDVKTVYIAPDGLLHMMPFDILTAPDGKMMIQKMPVHMVQTGRDLVATPSAETATGLVAVGDVDFGPIPPEEEQKTQVMLFDPLEKSGSEVEKIAGRYETYRDGESRTLLRDTGATETALRSLPQPPRVLHLATHAYYSDAGTMADDPLLQSGIALSGANLNASKNAPITQDNGILHASEAQTLNLSGTELVVLSACDSGKGAVDYSEGLEGLPRALYVAGAKNVLVALWPIYDGRTRDFMFDFYRAWLGQEHSDPAAALRQTKLQSLEKAGQRPSGLPAWAAFVLFEGAGASGR